MALYSGGSARENKKMDKEVLKLATSTSPRFTYVPFSNYESSFYYRNFVKQYEKMGIERFLYFPVDVPTDHVFRKEALNSEIIHLAGGNTYYFLKTLRESQIMPSLKEYVKSGGILTGLSAGAIVMTPSIHTAGFPEFDRDENQENMTNLTAMSLVQFHFYPHYENSLRYDRALRSFSRTVPLPVYAVSDGGGIIMHKKQATFIGSGAGFYQGKKFSIA